LIIHKTLKLAGVLSMLPPDARLEIIAAGFDEMEISISVENYYPGCPAVLKMDPLDSSPAEDAEYDAIPEEDYGARLLSDLFGAAASMKDLCRELTRYRSSGLSVIEILYHGVNDAVANLDLADDILQWEIEAKAEKAEYRADCEEEMKRW
jgi:hypothetical protein